MKPDVRAAALAALSASPHQYKGIRPAGASDQEAACRLLASSDADGFDEAAAAAGNHWPGETQWDLVASDFRLATEQDADQPEGIGCLGMPITLGRFGAAEDPGGESDY